MLSFGEWVGREVASAVDVTVVEVATRHDFRPLAKDRRRGDHRIAEGEFYFHDDLTGCAVLITDDVCQTGQTATATALAARRGQGRQRLRPSRRPHPPPLTLPLSPAAAPGPAPAAPGPRARGRRAKGAKRAAGEGWWRRRAGSAGPITL